MKKAIYILAFLLLATLSHNDAVQADATVNILCLGDSITQGGNGYPSYRAQLVTKCSGFPIAWVGTQTTCYGGNPETTTPHEGHWGYTSAQINNLSASLSTTEADITLYCIGTNDCGLGYPVGDTLNHMAATIGYLRSANPNMVILIGTTLRSTGLHEEFNLALASWVDTQSTTQSPVMLVDLRTGFDRPTMTYDTHHPNAIGEEFVAQRWFGALAGALRKVGAVGSSSLPLR
jgi:lysophospholipase L1-like esterase